MKDEDPAGPIVKALGRKGFRYLVLPLALLSYGKVEEVSEAPLPPLVDAARTPQFERVYQARMVLPYLEQLRLKSEVEDPSRLEEGDSLEEE